MLANAAVVNAVVNAAIRKQPYLNLAMLFSSKCCCALAGLLSKSLGLKGDKHT